MIGVPSSWAMPEVSAQESAGGAVPSEPYYVIMQIPGESEGEFVLIQPMVAANRPNMIAWVAARNDGEHYGQRIAFRFAVVRWPMNPSTTQKPSPFVSYRPSFVGVVEQAGS